MSADRSSVRQDRRGTVGVVRQRLVFPAGEGRSLAGGVPETSRRRSTAHPAVTRTLTIAVLVVLAAAPFFTSYYTVAIAIAIAVGVIGAVATNLLLGLAGQASIGNAALMAIGAFGAAQLDRHAHLPFYLAVPLSGLVAAAIGGLVALPAMRVRGLYLIIATLALHYITIFALTRWQSSEVGDAGYQLPSLRLAGLTNVASWYYVLVLVAVLTIVVARNLVRSRFGRAWATIARDETTAQVLGVHVWQQKVLVFALTSFIIGVQGALFGYYTGVVSIDVFTLDLSISYIAMIVIGGIGSLPGSVIGAAFVVGLPYLITWLADVVPLGDAGSSIKSALFDIQAIAYGAAIVVFLVWERRGLIHLWRKLVDRVSARAGRREVSRDE